MIGWITDNPLSKTVMESIPGITQFHINRFDEDLLRPWRTASPSIFYGILRGCGRAMHILAGNKIDYYYIDNGYFDALYVNKDMQKSMDGKFRVVKNGMHEVYPHKPVGMLAGNRILVIPPSPYSANFYDTTPEDWIAQVVGDLNERGYEVRMRNKSMNYPLGDDIEWCDGLVTFNSMAVMQSIAANKFTVDTHGIFRNYHILSSHPLYCLDSLKEYYESKQFTLDEFREGKCAWN